MLIFVRILVEMEDTINETWEDSIGRKAMSKVHFYNTHKKTDGGGLGIEGCHF